MGVDPADDDVLGPGARTADGNANGAADADRDRGREGHRIDLRVVAGGDRDRARTRIDDIGVFDGGQNLAVDGVARQGQTDGDGHAHSAEGRSHRRRAGEGMDARAVVGPQRHAVGVDGDRAEALAVDDGGDIDADPVLGEHARATGGHADGAPHGDGDGAGEHERLNALVGQRNQFECPSGIDGRVDQLRLDLERRGHITARLPADEVARHGNADRHADAGRSADADGDRRSNHGRRNRGVADRAEADIAGAAEHAALGIGVGLSQHHVLRHGPRAADGNAGRAAEAGGDRGCRRDGVDRALRNADLAGRAVQLEHEGLAVRRHERPALTGHQGRDLQRLGYEPVGAGVVLGGEVDVFAVGADEAVDDAARLHGGAFAQIPQLAQRLTGGGRCGQGLHDRRGRDGIGLAGGQLDEQPALVEVGGQRIVQHLHDVVRAAVDKAAGVRAREQHGIAVHVAVWRVHANPIGNAALDHGQPDHA